MILTASELGAVIRFEITPVAITGTINGSATQSASTAVVLPAEAAPIASNITISGIAQFGQTLTGNYVYSDVNGDLESGSIFHWYANDMLIPSANAKTYLVTANDIGANLKFEVTPIAGTGLTTGVAMPSAATSAVTAKTIDIAAISGIIAPAQKATPVTTATATAQYTATVTWIPDDDPFKNKVYTATITITPINGYTLDGVAANFFTVDGANPVTNPANSGIVSAPFPEKS